LDLRSGRPPWCCSTLAKFWTLGCASWRAAFLPHHLVTSAATRKLKRAGNLRAPGPPFQQRTNTACYLAIPTRGFTAAVSVFRGTPPPKPLCCKIRFALPGEVIGGSWAHHTGECLRTATAPVRAKFSLSPEDIIKMSRCSCSQIDSLSLTAIPTVRSAGKTKNPAYTR